MAEAFLTITEAVQYTGQSRRTLHRLAQHLAQMAPDQVLREKTAHGMIWRIHVQALAPATPPPPRLSPAATPATAPLVVPAAPEGESKALDLAHQGYTQLMTMHHEVKVAYEALLEEKEHRIQALTQALAQRPQGFWQRWFGP